MSGMRFPGRSVPVSRRAGALLAPISVAQVGAFMAAACVLIACQNKVTTSDGRPMPPKPHAPPALPDSARANTVVILLGAKPADTDGNGYPDLILAEAYLFCQPSPTPMFESGAFVITMYPTGRSAEAGAEPIRRWRIEGPVLERGRMIGRVGPAYGLQLSLRQEGDDRYPLTAADLVCTFEPADGRSPIQAKSVYTVQIGKQLVMGASSAP